MKKLAQISLLAGLFAGAFFASAPDANALILYMTPDGGGNVGQVNDGSNWQNAYSFDQYQEACFYLMMSPDQEKELRIGVGQYFVGAIAERPSPYANFDMVSGILVSGSWNPNSGNRLCDVNDDNSYVPYTQIIGNTYNDLDAYMPGHARIGTTTPVNSDLMFKYQMFQQGGLTRDYGVVRHFVTQDPSILDGVSIWQLPNGLFGTSESAAFREAELRCAMVEGNGILRNTISNDGRAGWGAGVCLIEGGRIENSIVQNCIGKATFTHFRGSAAQHTDEFPGWGAGVYVHGYGTMDSVQIRNCESFNGSGPCGEHIGRNFLSSNAYGGGFYVAPSDNYNAGTTPSRCDNSLISNCTSESHGGGTFINFTVHMTNTTFSGNSTDDNGGAIFSIFRDNMPGLVMDSCTLSNNIAVSGGGMYISSVGTASIIKNSLFKANEAPYGGGVNVYIHANFSKCTFDGNLSVYGGGAYVIRSVDFDLCRFVGNTVQPMNGLPTTRGGPSAYLYPTYTAGGGIYSESTAPYIRNCVIEENNVNEGHGGGFYGWYGGALDSCVVRNNTADYGAGIGTKFGGRYLFCDIYGNKANADGGGLHGGDGVNLHGSRVANNTAGGDGGGIHVTQDTVIITSSLFVNNSAAGNGGGIYFIGRKQDNLNGAGSIANCTIVNNRATGTGGGAYVSDAYLYNNIIWNNMSSGGNPEYFLGGNRSREDYNAIFDVEDKPTQIDLSNDNLSGSGPRFINPNVKVGNDDNWASYNWDLYDSSVCINAGLNTLIPTLAAGVADEHLAYDVHRLPRIQAYRVDIGAYEAQKTDTMIYVWKDAKGDKSGFTWRNAVPTILEAQDKLDGLGGKGEIRVAYGNYSATPYIMRPHQNVVGGWFPDSLYYGPSEFPSYLIGNRSNQVLIQEVDFTADSEAYWQGFHFKDGYNSISNGGAATVRVNGSIIESVFYDNFTDNNGGAVHLSGGTLSRCTVRNNRLTDFSTGSGGGIYVEHPTGAPSQILNCVVNENKAYTNGGGLYVVDGCEILNSSFAKNTARYGGGAYLLDSATVQSSTFTGNSADFMGGGLYLHGWNTSATGILVDSNLATANTPLMKGIGGGVYSLGGTVATSKIGNNFAYDGGGFFSDSGILVNSLIVNNAATHHGGGYYIRNDAATALSGYPSVVNCTVVNNTAQIITSDATTSPGAYIGRCYTSNNIYWGNNGNLSKQYYDAWGSDYYPTLSHCAAFLLVPLSDVVCYLDQVNDDREGPNFYNPNPNVGRDAGWLDYDWRIRSTSLCVNTGEPGMINTYPTDLAGARRVVAQMPDIGAYEAQDARVIRYVDVRSNGTGDGFSWRNAGSPDDIATFISMVATYGGEVRFRQGNYSLGTTINPASGVDLYGGYTGNGEERSGYSVMRVDGIRAMEQRADFATRTYIDGFWLTGGSTMASDGGGGAVLRKNAVFQNNMVSECSSDVLGGGLAVYGSEVYNVTVANNRVVNSTSSPVYTGGGIYGADSAIFAGCLVVNNQAPWVGGVKLVGGCTFINGTIARNLSSLSHLNDCGSGIDATATTGVYVDNNVIWQNAHGVGTADARQAWMHGPISASHNAVQGENTWIDLNANNNDIAGPQFINPSTTAGCLTAWRSYDWHMKPASICVDNGSNTTVNTLSAVYTTDLDGNARIFNKVVDLGPYEAIYVQLNLTRGQIVATGALVGKFNPGDVVPIAGVNPSSSTMTFNQWTGDIAYIVNARAEKTTVTMPNKNIALVANYVNSTSGTGGGGIDASAPLRITIPYASLMPGYDKASSSISISGGGGFSKKPKVYLQVENSKKKYPCVVLDDFIAGVSSFSVAYIGSYKLYSNKALKEHYAQGKSVQTFSSERGENLPATVSVFAKVPGEAYPRLIYVDSKIVPAKAHWVDMKHTLAKSDEMGACPPNADGKYGLLSVKAGAEMLVEGRGFGAKKPKVWLEYKDGTITKGKTVKIPLKVSSGAKTCVDDRGNASYSGAYNMVDMSSTYMNTFDVSNLDNFADARNSLLPIVMPSAPLKYNGKTLPSKGYILVIDTGKSLAYLSVYYQPE